MGDTILHGVLNMPPDLWTNDELDKQQRFSRYQEASEKILKYKEKKFFVKKHLAARILCSVMSR